MPRSPQTFRPTQQRNWQKMAEHRRGTKQARGYGGEWEKISKIVRAEHPVCQMCESAPSAHTDHIKPFDGLLDPLRTDYDNLQALCVDCHIQKTLKDAQNRAK